MATEPPAPVQFELTLLHLRGYQPRSHIIGGALLRNRRR
jgi:hypothetical protein